MKTTFKLRNGKKTNTILLDFRFGREIRVRYSTNLKIKKSSKKYWDSSKGRIKIPNDIINYRYVNDSLKNYEEGIETAITELLNCNKLSQNNCSKAIREVLGICSDAEEKNKSRSNNVVEYFDWFLDYYSTNNSPFTRTPLNSGTLKTYKNSKNFLVKYLNHKKITTFYFEDIDEKFYNDYINYSKNKGYSRNYIGTNIQKLKTVIGYAYENNVHNNDEYKKRYFAKLQEEINHPYLNEDELSAINKLKLDDKLENDVRDIFLIGSYTGLRVGDLTNFLKSPILMSGNGKEFINLKQSKTGGEVYIPINKIIKGILKRRGGKFPPNIHPNKINKIIKVIARKAEIKGDFTLERTVNDKKIKVIKPKHKFISAHTARRSFCTNAYNAGMQPHLIMVMSGHKSEKVFYNYIKASVKRKALQVAEHPFFQ